MAFASVPPEGARKLPRHALPVVLIARLAVDRTMQGQRIGEMLLLDNELHLYLPVATIRASFPKS